MPCVPGGFVLSSQILDCLAGGFGVARELGTEDWSRVWVLGQVGRGLQKSTGPERSCPHGYRGCVCCRPHRNRVHAGCSIYGSLRDLCHRYGHDALCACFFFKKFVFQVFPLCKVLMSVSVDLSPWRLRLARDMGATCTVLVTPEGRGGSDAGEGGGGGGGRGGAAGGGGLSGGGARGARAVADRVVSAMGGQRPTHTIETSGAESSLRTAIYVSEHPPACPGRGQGEDLGKGLGTGTREQGGVQGGVLGWGSRKGSWAGDPGRGPELGVQEGVLGWGSREGSWAGGPGRGPGLGIQGGVLGWGSREGSWAGGLGGGTGSSEEFREGSWAGDPGRGPGLGVLAGARAAGRGHGEGVHGGLWEGHGQWAGPSIIQTTVSIRIVNPGFPECTTETKVVTGLQDMS